MRWPDIERAMEVYVGDGRDDNLGQAMMEERLAQHFGDRVPEVKPQLDGDLDLVLRCYRKYCEHYPPKNLEEATNNARTVVGDVLEHYAKSTRNMVANYVVRQGWQDDAAHA